MGARVVVVGGGYGGIAVARALDEVAEVTLVEPRDTFVHAVGALRGLVDRHWAERIFLPYQGLLRHGRVLRDLAERVDGESVLLASGQRLAADHVVLATGSAYPFPAKFDELDSAAALARLRSARAALGQARSVLLLGAGPVGLELAGEITAVSPETEVTIVDPVPDVLGGGYTEPLRRELRDQLRARGVRLLLGTTLAREPSTAIGVPGDLRVHTTSGERIVAQLWFRCFGVSPNSGYLAGGPRAAREPDGFVRVGPDLRVAGQRNVFAIGDLTAIAEAKTAKAAGEHAKVVAAVITASITGGAAPEPYRPGPAGISIPLGPHGGASYSPAAGLLGPDETARLKGTHLRLDSYRELLGISLPA